MMTILFYMWGCFACVYVCTQCTYLVPAKPEVDTASPATAVTDVCELQCECWQSKPGSSGRAASTFIACAPGICVIFFFYVEDSQEPIPEHSSCCVLFLIILIFGKFPLSCRHSGLPNLYTLQEAEFLSIRLVHSCYIYFSV